MTPSMGPCYAEGHSPLALAIGGVRPVPPTPAETEKSEFWKWKKLGHLTKIERKGAQICIPV